MREYFLLLRYELRMARRTLRLTGMIVAVIIALPVLLSPWLDGEDLSQFMSFTCSVIELWVFFLAPIFGVIAAVHMAGREGSNAHEWLTGSLQKRFLAAFVSWAVILLTGAGAIRLFIAAGYRYFPDNIGRFASITEEITQHGGPGFRMFMVASLLFAYALVYLVTLLIIRLPRLLIQLTPYLFGLIWGMGTLIVFVFELPDFSIAPFVLLTPFALIFALSTAACCWYWLNDLAHRQRIDNVAVLKGIGSLAAGVLAFGLAACLVVKRSAAILRYELPLLSASIRNDSRGLNADSPEVIFLTDAQGHIVKIGADGKRERINPPETRGLIDLFLQPNPYQYYYSPNRTHVYSLAKGGPVLFNKDNVRWHWRIGQQSIEGQVRWREMDSPIFQHNPAIVIQGENISIIDGSIGDLLMSTQQSFRISSLPSDQQKTIWSTLPMDAHPHFAGGETAIRAGAAGHYRLRWRSGDGIHECEPGPEAEVRIYRNATHLSGKHAFIVFTKRDSKQKERLMMCTDGGVIMTSWVFSSYSPLFVNQNDEIAFYDFGKLYYTNEINKYPVPVVLSFGKAAGKEHPGPTYLFHLENGMLWALGENAEALWKIDARTGSIVQRTKLPEQPKASYHYEFITATTNLGFFYSTETTLYFIAWDGTIRNLGLLKYLP